jgi:hypothetical protein
VTGYLTLVFPFLLILLDLSKDPGEFLGCDTRLPVEIGPRVGYAGPPTWNVRDHLYDGRTHTIIIWRLKMKLPEPQNIWKYVKF